MGFSSRNRKLVLQKCVKNKNNVFTKLQVKKEKSYQKHLNKWKER